LKTLSILGDLVVHYSYCESVAAAEQSMLEAFVKGVAPGARKKLHDSERVMPFANLEHPPGTRKQHGITGATAPRRKGSTTRQTTSGVAPRDLDGAESIDEPPDTALTQPIRPGDLSSGIIRVPKARSGAFRRARDGLTLSFMVTISASADGILGSGQTRIGPGSSESERGR
jgi:hypothetical protein